MQNRIGDMNRRELLKLVGLGIGGTLGGSAWPLKVQAQSGKVTPRGNVRNVIVIQNCGAMSPPETLDFKDTKYTTNDPDIHQPGSVERELFSNRIRIVARQVRGTRSQHYHRISGLRRRWERWPGPGPGETVGCTQQIVRGFTCRRSSNWFEGRRVRGA